MSESVLRVKNLTPRLRTQEGRKEEREIPMFDVLDKPSYLWVS